MAILKEFRVYLLSEIVEKSTFIFASKNRLQPAINAIYFARTSLSLYMSLWCLPRQK